MLKRKKVLALLLSFSLVASIMPTNVVNVSAAGTSVAAVTDSSELTLKEANQGLEINWENYENAASYDVYRANSRYGNYQLIKTVSGKSYTDTAANMNNKYANYYKVAVAGSNELSDPISLEIEMFGEDMYVFSPEDDVEQVYNAVNEVYKVQGAVDAEGNANADQQFGDGRYAFAFKTGDYSNMSATHFDMSYYMQLIGLGKVPTDVKIRNVHVPPVLPNWNVTCNFWMGIENLSIVPDAGGSTDVWFDFMWSVSQAAPARRLYVDRPTSLNFMWDGWASGGYIADSIFTQKVGSWTQQQYYIRNSELRNNIYGINWNLVTQGVTGVTTNDAKYPMYELESGLGQTNWKSGGKYTFLDSTDVVREKPFLYFDEADKEYKVFVPGLREDSVGVSWSQSDMGEGVSIDIDKFYVARADRDNAASINAALDAGYNLILSPGIYYAEEPIEVEQANTVVLGLGLATIIPTNTEAAITVDDVGGVTIAGVILDADSHSENMIVVGEEGCNKDHSANPTLLQDVFVRVGGVHGGVASTESAVLINSNDVIGDHFWIWRADHGDGVAWDLNKAKNGVVVNGDDVTLYGLMVEHFQEYDVLWRGENGKTYFLQNEKCYDPQAQDGWMSHDGTVKGYAAYKVANNVKNHYAVGLGTYDVFINTNGASIFLDSACEVPNTEGVKIENYCIVEIANGEGPLVGINSVINGTGAGISTGVGGKGYARQAVLSYSNGKSLAMEDYYLTGGNDSGNVSQVTGTAPTNDPNAEKTINKAAASVDPDEMYLIDYWKAVNNGTIVRGPVDDEDPVVPDPSVKVNVLEGATATASSVKGGNAAVNAIDDNMGSRWETIDSEPNPQWIQFELDKTYSVDEFKIAWETASAKDYTVQVSTDGTNWTTVYTVTDGKQGETKADTFDAAVANYIRVLCTSKTTGYGYSIWEMEVLGVEDDSIPVPEPPIPEPPIPGVNVLEGATATASTVKGGNEAANAIDNNMGSRWETIDSAPNPQWIQFELNDTYTVDSFKIAWETASAKDYEVQTSVDGSNWTTVYVVNDGKQGETIEASFEAIEAKYVRILCTSKTTGYGYSIWEMEVYSAGFVNEMPPVDPEPPVIGEKVNVLANAVATTSTVKGGNVAANAIDNNMGSRWETEDSAPNPQWLQFELDDTYTIDSFKIVWETASAKDYALEVSMDGKEWTPVYTVNDGKQGETKEDTFAATQAKYVRVLCTSKTTQYAYSIWEMEVMGTK